VKTTAWGSQGLEASVEGLGAMGMSAFYGNRDDEESTATLNRALDLGITMIDTAEAYGPFLNERLIGEAIGKRRDEYALATKFARRLEDDGTGGPPDGSPTYARRALERSLKNLGMDTIDLYYLHRVDPNTPIEETVGAMAEFVEEGKVLYLGLSEAAPETIRRAHATHPITAVQTEYSLFASWASSSSPTRRSAGVSSPVRSPLPTIWPKTTGGAACPASVTTT
jgi:aryl-alcohol dehydrogenase-like predicted oxidoreductase